MPVKLKICGITRLEDALTAVRLGVDWLGFNFFSASPRFIAPQNAAAIIAQLPPTVECVGILVRPTLSEVLRVVEKSHVRRIQIYEPQDFGDFKCLPVPGIIGLRFIDGRLPEYERYRADMLLVDSYTPNLFGGTGIVLEWQRIPLHIPREKLILAGGLNPGNIRQALEMVTPAVVDVASGAESAPGFKDTAKMKALVEQVHRYNREKSI
jgi:phosphoribosylanthranilate isomerase